MAFSNIPRYLVSASLRYRIVVSALISLASQQWFRLEWHLEPPARQSPAQIIEQLQALVNGRGFPAAGINLPFWRGEDGRPREPLNPGPTCIIKGSCPHLKSGWHQIKFQLLPGADKD